MGSQNGDPKLLRIIDGAEAIELLTFTVLRLVKRGDVTKQPED